jgi:hypothetical protein
MRTFQPHLAILPILFCSTALAGGIGLILNTPAAFEGYTLFSPLDSANTYLIDNEGRFIREWHTAYKGSAAYLLENGNLLRTASLGNRGNRHFHGGGAGYGIEELTWDGELVWEFVYASEDYLMHHDIEPMPNGNVLVIAWERKTREEAIAAGRDPELLGPDGLWPLHVIEVAPERPKSGRVVWSWHLWDHLIQDFDETKANYGDVAAHPERVDINPPGLWMARITQEEQERLEALGYLGGGAAEHEPDQDQERRRRRARSADWMHTNAIAYNAELEQIALSALGNNELWIIDHSSSPEEARGGTGGRYGRGGRLLYRWGNPMAYRAGTDADQRLFAQHDVRWIPEGYPGAGNLTLFNNGRGRPEGSYSSVLEIAPPLDARGGYARAPDAPFGPDEPHWKYTAPHKPDFYSSFLSGAVRLPNGNTLVCQGADGTFFEVTPDKELVWKFVNPAKGPPGASHRGPDREPTNSVFRVLRYAPDYPAFAGKDLTPGPPLTEYLKTNPAVAPTATLSADP